MDITCPRCECEFEDKTWNGGQCPDCNLDYWWDDGYVPNTDIDYYLIVWEKYDS